MAHVSFMAHEEGKKNEFYGLAYKKRGSMRDRHDYEPVPRPRVIFH